MVKEKKKSILLTIVCALVLVLSLSVLAGCSNDNSTTAAPKVTFMMRANGTGDWGSVATVDAKDGKVQLPDLTNVPKGYSFRGWFLDEACETAFDENNVSKDVTVYAFLTNKILTANIKTVDEDIKLTDKSLADLNTIEEEHKTLAANKSLTFDGWYTNADCTTKFNAESDTTEVFARYAAAVTYTNGYEIDDIVKYVAPGSKLTKPEIADVKKDYMNEEGISFVDSLGQPFDYKNAVINTNTVIRILWQTPGLDIVPIEGTEYYRVLGFRSDFVTKSRELMESFKVLSIPGKIVQGTKTYDIASVNGSNLYLATSVEKVIFNEGIKYIDAFQGNLTNNSQVKEFVFPSTLQIIESSFKRFPLVNEYKLNEGLVSIIDCFDDANKNSVCVVPSTVTNIAKVPATLDFSKNTKFTNDHDRVYMNDETLGKVLISESASNMDENKTINVPADVEAIQVRAFDGIDYDYLNIPASFKAVSYNIEKTAEMTWYTGLSLLTDVSLVEPEGNPTLDKNMSTDAFSIIEDLDNHKYITIDAVAFPLDVNPYAFNSRGKKYDELEKLNVVLVGTIAEGTVNITINVTNKMTNDVQELVITKNVGETITQEEINELIGLTELQEIKLQKEFGIDFDLTQTMDRNHYIDIVTSVVAEGYQYEIVGEEAHITGFNQETAKNLALQGEDDKYLVIIPDSIEGKPVTQINDNAFKGVNTLSQIYIASSVKHIGDYAFANTTLLELVDIASGGLETIGEGAFEYAGAKQEEIVKEEVQEEAQATADAEKQYQWVVNGSLKNKELVMKLPIAKLDKTIPTAADEKFAIGPRAFNTPSIKVFEDVDNVGRVGTFKLNAGETAYEVGKYYFYGSQAANGIVQFNKCVKENKQDVQYFNYLATAGGTTQSQGMILGCASFGFDTSTVDAIAKIELEEGSFALYSDAPSNIYWFAVSKVKANSFVYLNSKYTDVVVDGETTKTTWMEQWDPSMAQVSKNCNNRELFINQDSSIFEEGWFMGRPNSENTFIKTVGLRQSGVAGMN